MSERDLAFEEWVQRARDIPTIEAAYRLGFKPLPRLGGSVKKIGACTACGVSGSSNPARADRFCVFISGPKAGGFKCRKCDISGKDAIALVERSLGRTFLEAVEFLTGDRPPRGGDNRTEEQRAAAREVLEAKRRENEQRQQEAEAAAQREEAKRVELAAAVWRNNGRIEGTPVEGYLRHRGASSLEGLNLGECGFAKALRLKNDDGIILHTGPAMVWQVIGRGGALVAVHRTWIDPESFAVPGSKGRPSVKDSDTGASVATKKTLGAKRGGIIRMVRGVQQDGTPPRRLFMGEGIETLIGVREPLMRAGHPFLQGAAFWSACDLGNFGEITIPDSFEEIFLLGDGDSDRKTVDHFFMAFIRRNNRPGRTFRPTFAAEGVDFSDMWRAAWGQQAAIPDGPLG